VHNFSSNDFKSFVRSTDEDGIKGEASFSADNNNTLLRFSCDKGYIPVVKFELGLREK